MASDLEENDMKWIRHIAVAALLGVGMIGVAQAHVFVGVGVGLPAMPVAPVMPIAPVVAVAPVPVYAPPPVYVPPPVYYAPPPASVVVGGYWGAPRWPHRYYGYGYWR
jgi:hypothetical protein